MNIPNLPTDNLYKFIALSGVVISLTCAIIPNITIKEIRDEITTIETERGELEFEIKILKERKIEILTNIAKVDSMLDRYEYDDLINVGIDLADLVERLHDPEHREYLQFIYDNKNNILPEVKLLEGNRNQIQQLNEINNEIRFKAHRIERKLELLKLKTGEINSSIWKWAIGLLVGFIMMNYGFRLWYVKVQKLLDEKLKKELTKTTNKPH